MSRVLNIVYSLLEAGPDDPEIDPADAIDPKQAMMKVDPAADIKRLIRQLTKEDLQVKAWIREGDILKLIATPLDGHMDEQEMETSLWACLQHKLGVNVDPGAVTVRKSNDGLSFVCMFPFPGMRAASNKRFFVRESGPDDLDPKSELLNTEPNGVAWLVANGFQPFHPGSTDSYRRAFTHGWANVGLTGVDATPYEVTIQYRDGARRAYYSQTFDEMKQRLLHHRVIAESEDPDAIDPKSELMSVPSPYLELRSQIKPASEGTASLQVVLRPGMRQGEWVTRIRNADDGGESWGHYFDDYEKALADYEVRCEKYGIPPSPPQEIKTVYEAGPDDVSPVDMLKGLPKPILIQLSVDSTGDDPDVIAHEHKVEVDGTDYLKSISPKQLAKYYRFAKNRPQKTFVLSFMDDSTAAVQRFSQWPEAHGLVALLRGGMGSARMTFNSDEIMRWVEENRPEVLKEFGEPPIHEDAGPDNVDPRDYLRALPERDPRISITYARTTPESSAEGDFSENGWIDQEGESMWPDSVDQEEGVGVVDKAVEFLRDAGAIHPSSSDFHPGVWWSTEWAVVDYATGENEERAYHLHGFTPDEERQIWIAIRGPNRAGR